MEHGLCGGPAGLRHEVSHADDYGFFSKEALAIEVGQRLRSEHVIAALKRLAARRGPPQYLFVDNGSEFSGQLLDFGRTTTGTDRLHPSGKANRQLPHRNV
ncbi:hypothetical protein SAMN05216387_1031 [Nitrosovibrio tenuis]|uniref:Integrase core domain-containing protein n=1 Tax=Nitrosovibrio tenuis TaxID=1233 RepID=A0A1H7JTV0_9PROT|nr:hypothetical protein SAMN05216387_1031 [Nitrosovibrio tenuis]